MKTEIQEIKRLLGEFDSTGGFFALQKGTINDNGLALRDEILKRLQLAEEEHLALLSAAAAAEQALEALRLVWDDKSARFSTVHKGLPLSEVLRNAISTTALSLSGLDIIHEVAKRLKLAEEEHAALVAVAEWARQFKIEQRNVDTVIANNLGVCLRDLAAVRAGK